MKRRRLQGGLHQQLQQHGVLHGVGPGQGIPQGDGLEDPEGTGSGDLEGAGLGEPQSAGHGVPRDPPPEEPPSNLLAMKLVEKWCWGSMALPTLQELADAAAQDGLDEPLLRCLVWGQNSNKQQLNLTALGCLFLGTLLK